MYLIQGGLHILGTQSWLLFRDILVVLKRTVLFVGLSGKDSLTAESVEGTSLSLQSIDNIHGCDCLPLGMLSVCDCITDDIFQENFEYTSGFLVDETGDTFYTTSASETTDSGLCDTLDVIPQHFPVTLGATLSESLTSFATSRHDAVFLSIAVSRMTCSVKSGGIYSRLVVRQVRRTQRRWPKPSVS